MQELAETNTSSEAIVLSVEQLNREVRSLIEAKLSLVWVQGEISNFKAHSSGHFYLSLKDAKSQIRAVMFRGHNARLRFKPTDGMEVIVRGRVTVYEPRGEYQINIETMEPVGAGALQKAFEQLKEKLKAEGLFDASRKRPLPSLPRHVAIVTSPTGAAIRDMINVLSRRNRSVRITVVPTVVQGEGSAVKICEALRLAQTLPEVDTIIIGRGGGSIEDMWGFNDETLARMIAASPIPVISAVGHEIDFTIADFVADLRAPTPSAAAELVVKSTEDLAHRLESLRRLLMNTVLKELKMKSHQLMAISARLVDPKRRLNDLAQRNDELGGRLQQAMATYLQHVAFEITVLKQRLASPQNLIQDRRARLGLVTLKMRNISASALEVKNLKLSRLMSLLESLSPLKVVDRGYAVAKKSGQLLKSSKQVAVGDRIDVQLSDGSIRADVVEILS